MDRSLGVVKGGVVLLPEGVHLPEGLAVEIRILTPEVAGNEQLPPEEQVKQELLAEGILTRIARPTPIPLDEDRTPVTVEGELLSQQIIRERR